MPRRLWHWQVVVVIVGLLCACARLQFGVYAAIAIGAFCLIHPGFLFAERLAAWGQSRGAAGAFVALGLTFAVLWCLFLVGMTSSALFVYRLIS